MAVNITVPEEPLAMKALSSRSRAHQIERLRACAC
jgi:hypothetical protein